MDSWEDKMILRGGSEGPVIGRCRDDFQSIGKNHSEKM